MQNMRNLSAEYVQAVQFLNGCGGDVLNAVERLENLIDAFFINGQREKAERVEKILLIIKKGI